MTTKQNKYILKIKQYFERFIPRMRGKWLQFWTKRRQVVLVFSEVIGFSLFISITLEYFNIINGRNVPFWLTGLAGISIYFIWQELHGQILSYFRNFKRGK